MKPTHASLAARLSPSASRRDARPLPVTRRNASRSRVHRAFSAFSLQTTPACSDGMSSACMMPAYHTRELSAWRATHVSASLDVRASSWPTRSRSGPFTLSTKARKLSSYCMSRHAVCAARRHVRPCVRRRPPSRRLAVGGCASGWLQRGVISTRALRQRVRERLRQRAKGVRAFSSCQYRTRSLLASKFSPPRTRAPWSAEAQKARAGGESVTGEGQQHRSSAQIDSAGGLTAAPVHLSAQLSLAAQRWPGAHSSIH